MIYHCSGTPSEKLEWFKTINIAGEKLTNQELRNAVYSGPWVSDAKRYFSKKGCVAYNLGEKFMSGEVNRQDYLEKIILWISKDGNIEKYMAEHQHNDNAEELWIYFQGIIGWIKTYFIDYRKEMKNVPWGPLYNEHKDNKSLKPSKLKAEIDTLMLDEEVENKKGIYSYVLDGNQKHLNLRDFSLNIKRNVYEKQKGICPFCKKHFDFDAMEADHIMPWHKGGKTIESNCQLLCVTDNRSKSGK